MTSTAPDSAVTTLHGEAEFLARAGHLFAPTTEFVCAAVDLSTWARSGRQEQLREHLRVRQHLADGLRMRKMFNPAALADPDSERHLLELAAEGVPIRICTATLAHETIIIDGKVAILAGPPVAGVRDYTVVRSPEVIAGVRSLFTASWDTAVDLAEYRRSRPPIRPEDRPILRLLSAGRKDESAARELGMSVRTYRRRVADLMTALGAESRFQAGARAHTLDLP
jgi:DNA-binding CsgD family transcriptional regulator